jgi:hypothetical protein
MSSIKRRPPSSSDGQGGPPRPRPSGRPKKTADYGQAETPYGRVVFKRGDDDEGGGGGRPARGGRPQGSYDKEGGWPRRQADEGCDRPPRRPRHDEDGGGRPAGGPKGYGPKRDFGPKGYGPKKDFGPKGYGPKKDFGPKGHGPKKDFGPKGYGPKRDFGPKGYGPKKDFGPKSWGQDKGFPKPAKAALRPSQSAALAAAADREIPASLKRLAEAEGQCLKAAETILELSETIQGLLGRLAEGGSAPESLAGALSAVAEAMAPIPERLSLSASFHDLAGQRMAKVADFLEDLGPILEEILEEQPPRKPREAAPPAPTPKPKARDAGYEDEDEGFLDERPAKRAERKAGKKAKRAAEDEELFVDMAALGLDPDEYQLLEVGPSPDGKPIPIEKLLEYADKALAEGRADIGLDDAAARRAAKKAAKRAAKKAAKAAAEAEAAGLPGGGGEEGAESARKASPPLPAGAGDGPEPFGAPEPAPKAKKGKRAAAEAEPEPKPKKTKKAPAEPEPEPEPGPKPKKAKKAPAEAEPEPGPGPKPKKAK